MPEFQILMYNSWWCFCLDISYVTSHLYGKPSWKLFTKIPSPDTKWVITDYLFRVKPEYTSHANEKEREFGWALANQLFVNIDNKDQIWKCDKAIYSQFEKTNSMNSNATFRVSPGKYNKWCERRPLVCSDKAIISKAHKHLVKTGLTSTEKATMFLHDLVNCQGLEFCF